MRRKYRRMSSILAMCPANKMRRPKARLLSTRAQSDLDVDNDKCGVDASRWLLLRLHGSQRGTLQVVGHARSYLCGRQLHNETERVRNAKAHVRTRERVSVDIEQLVRTGHTVLVQAGLHRQVLSIHDHVSYGLDLFGAVWPQVRLALSFKVRF